MLSLFGLVPITTSSIKKSIERSNWIRAEQKIRYFRKSEDVLSSNHEDLVSKKSVISEENLLIFAIQHTAPYKILSLLIETGLGDLSETDLNGYTPLIHAVHLNCDEQTIRILCNENVINHKDHQGQTALHHAILSITSSQSLMIDTLISLGAKLDSKDSLGQTILNLACRDNCSSQVVECIVKQSGGTALVNLSDNYGFSPLVNAVMRNNTSLETVNLLLHYGAQVNSKVIEQAQLFRSPAFQFFMHRNA
jgi:ankyrin repeat protein